VAIITGTRAEFGLLRPVMDAVQAHPALELLVIVTGEHLLPPAETAGEVRGAFDVAGEVAMQRPGRTGRLADAEALGRGVAGMSRLYEQLQPDWAVVLGDRIEALAGATAASVGGIAVAHLHGGDRAEGVADEAMRHAISKLAHLHLPATDASARRLVRMGENERFVHVVGSPAMDGLRDVQPMGDAEAGELGDPTAVLLLHPVGRSEAEERETADRVIAALRDERVLALHPNHDAGRGGILAAIEAASRDRPDSFRAEAHLPRERFVSLLARMAERRGIIVGNSSAGLIEASALRCPAVDIGPRQGGRERAGNVVTIADPSELPAALERARAIPQDSMTHPYGDGRTGERVAALLASIDPHDPALLRKRCAY
jgi:UDP-hydrolysing UDP-N-acetyl-D-glucosamine 2-epimerase